MKSLTPETIQDHTHDIKETVSAWERIDVYERLKVVEKIKVWENYTNELIQEIDELKSELDDEKNERIHYQDRLRESGEW